MEVKQGIFYGVGVGPGDPELLTMKALRTLERCPVVAAPRTKSGGALALDIVRRAVSLDGKILLPLEFTMSRDPEVLREARQKAKEAGRYNGELPFRIELEGKECRIYFDGSQPHQIFDCRTFRTAVECDEIVWITGKRMAGLPLPKAQLEGSPGDLRRWLKPYVAIWYTCPIPEKLKAAVTGQEVAD